MTNCHPVRRKRAEDPEPLIGQFVGRNIKVPVLKNIKVYLSPAKVQFKKLFAFLVNKKNSKTKIKTQLSFDRFGNYIC